MIRVLHILGGLHAGGMESMIMNYYRYLNREKIQFDFLVFSDRSFFDDEVEKLGGRIYRITPRRKNFIKNYIELDNFFKEHKEYKIVHIHQGINYFTPLIKAKKYGVKNRIVHSHGMDPRLIKKQGKLFDIYTVPKIMNLGTNFIACSNNAAKQLFSKSAYESKIYKIMANAIDTNKYSKDNIKRKITRERLNIENKFVIGHVGNFTYPKNHEFIIDVYSEIFKKNKNSILLLVGIGSKMEDIKTKVKNLGLTQNVIFLGNRRDVDEILNAMDCFVYPSHYEGLPLALIEAQACGVKCYVSSTITEEVKVSDRFRYIELESGAQEWANIILNDDLLKNESYKIRIRECGFDIDYESMKMQQYYEILANQNEDIN